MLGVDPECVAVAEPHEVSNYIKEDQEPQKPQKFFLN
jgi:hypothetical protein